MFKKNESHESGEKNTDELLCYYRNEAIAAMHSVAEIMKTHAIDNPYLALSPVTTYINGLEKILTTPNVNKRIPLHKWSLQVASAIIPPLRLPPWLNIGGN
jgi:hypothetical protein